MAEKHLKGRLLNRPPWCPPLVWAAISLRARDSNCLQGHQKRVCDSSHDLFDDSVIGRVASFQISKTGKPGLARSTVSLRACSTCAQPSTLQKAQASPPWQAPQRVLMAAMLLPQPRSNPHRGQAEWEHTFQHPTKCRRDGAGSLQHIWS